MARAEQPLGQVRSDETAPACEQNLHGSRGV